MDTNNPHVARSMIDMFSYHLLGIVVDKIGDFAGKVPHDPREDSAFYEAVLCDVLQKFVAFLRNSNLPVDHELLIAFDTLVQSIAGRRQQEVPEVFAIGDTEGTELSDATTEFDAIREKRSRVVSKGGKRVFRMPSPSWPDPSAPHQPRLGQSDWTNGRAPEGFEYEIDEFGFAIPTESGLHEAYQRFANLRKEEIVFFGQLLTFFQEVHRWSVQHGYGPFLSDLEEAEAAEASRTDE